MYAEGKREGGKIIIVLVLVLVLVLKKKSLSLPEENNP